MLDLKGKSDFENACSIFSFMCGKSPTMNYQVIKGEPYSKARPRFSKSGRVYNTHKQKSNELYLKQQLRMQFKEPVKTNLAVGCIFYRSTKQRIDVDNMLKNVMDAANGIIYIDDSQVTAKFGVVELDKNNPRTVIVIGNHQTTMERTIITEVKCVACGKEFTKSGSSKMGKYCNRECAAVGKLSYSKEPVKCLACENEFIKKTKLQKFCSDVCRRNDVRKRNKKLKIYETAYCEICNKKLSKPTYKRCRGCWTVRGENY